MFDTHKCGDQYRLCNGVSYQVIASVEEDNDRCLSSFIGQSRPTLAHRARTPGMLNVHLAYVNIQLVFMNMRDHYGLILLIFND